MTERSTTRSILPDPLHRALRTQAQALSFGALAHLLRQLLLQMGYTGVHVRRTRNKGRNGYVAGEKSAGGWDIEAAWETGIAAHRLIVQLRHYPGRAVQLRCVDELRGALARARADHALLVTTGGFSPQAREAADAGGAGGELTLLDGDALARLLADWRVGLRQDPQGKREVDVALFYRLARQFPERTAPSPASSTGSASGKDGGDPPGAGVTVIVSLRP